MFWNFITSGIFSIHSWLNPWMQNPWVQRAACLRFPQPQSPKGPNLVAFKTPCQAGLASLGEMESPFPSKRLRSGSKTCPNLTLVPTQVFPGATATHWLGMSLAHGSHHLSALSMLAPGKSCTLSITKLKGQE